MNLDRFKLRVWSIPDKEMTYPDSIEDKDGLSGIVFLSEYIQAVWENEPDDNFVLMQCTGLKDSEGKLIWEGDVIDSHFWWWSGRAYKVQWFGHGFHAFELDKSVGANFITDWANECKVIGNIYETPELLATHGREA